MSLEVDNPAGGAGGGGESANRLSLKRHDSLFGDAEKVSGGKYHGSEGSWARTLHLAFQSVGIIYGDIGTSPLYVYSSTFPDGIKYNDDLLGVLSLIIYTLIIISSPRRASLLVASTSRPPNDSARGQFNSIRFRPCCRRRAPGPLHT